MKQEVDVNAINSLNCQNYHSHSHTHTLFNVPPNGNGKQVLFDLNIQLLIIS